jgi:hypothetical protein
VTSVNQKSGTSGIMRRVEDPKFQETRAVDHTGRRYVPTIRDVSEPQGTGGCRRRPGRLEQKTVDAVLRSLQSTLEDAAAKGEKVVSRGFFALSVGRREAVRAATGYWPGDHHPGREHREAYAGSAR